MEPGLSRLALYVPKLSGWRHFELPSIKGAVISTYKSKITFDPLRNEVTCSQTHVWNTFLHNVAWLLGFENIDTEA